MKRYIYYVLICLLLPLRVAAQTDGYDPVNPPNPNWPDDNTTQYYKVVREAIPYGAGKFSLNNNTLFKAGETVTITAEDHNDCYFICWKDIEGNEVTTNRTLQFTMPASDVKYYAIFGHCGDESGHKLLLDAMGAKPLLSLGLRLGEGTGAICAYPIVDSAVRMINEMESFQKASITKYF